MMDQAAVLRTRAFPTAMLLPMSFPYTDDGLADGVRRFTDALAKPAVVYIKSAGYLAPATVARLIEEGRIVALKYAVVRDDPLRDDYLRALLDEVEARWIVSGIGERPAIAHYRHFGLSSFTSGSVCVAPRVPCACCGCWPRALRRGRQRAPALPGSGGLPRRHQPHPCAARCGDAGRRGRHGADAALADGAVRRRTRTRGAGGARAGRVGPGNHGA